MPVSANLDAVLDKEWENKSLEEILKAPVNALAGVSDGDAAALQQAFNVKTVGDLAAASSSGRPRRWRCSPSPPARTVAVLSAAPLSLVCRPLPPGRRRPGPGPPPGACGSLLPVAASGMGSRCHWPRIDTRPPGLWWRRVDVRQKVRPDRRGRPPAGPVGDYLPAAAPTVRPPGSTWRRKHRRRQR
jgi:hypothetical protein